MAIPSELEKSVRRAVNGYGTALELDLMNEQHVYLSTACAHNEHGNCRKTCKYCEQDCICHCHVGA
jgi:hypothetical protein